MSATSRDLQRQVWQRQPMYFGDSPGRHARLLDTRVAIDLDRMLERLLWSVIPISGGLRKFRKFVKTPGPEKGSPT